MRAERGPFSLKSSSAPASGARFLLKRRGAIKLKAFFLVFDARIGRQPDRPAIGRREGLAKIGRLYAAKEPLEHGRIGRPLRDAEAHALPAKRCDQEIEARRDVTERHGRRALRERSIMAPEPLRKDRRV